MAYNGRGVGRTDGEECTEAESYLIGREREEMMVIDVRRLDR